MHVGAIIHKVRKERKLTLSELSQKSGVALATLSRIEKFIFVLDGRIEAHLGDEVYNLTRGDTLDFESSIPHHFKNSGAGEASIICVISPPTS